jgi:nickel-dependent lactate racemase
VPGDHPVDVVEPPPTAAVTDDPFGLVQQAVDTPVGGFSWGVFEGAGSVAIAINDKTRPVPHAHLLPPLLDRLATLGVADEAITFYVAVGSHPPMRPDELPAILPADVLTRYRVVSHDADAADDLVRLGETSRGTPVWVNRAYAEAERRIVVGNLEPHQFVGFSGGVKSAAIGLAGRATIDANHALLAHPHSKIGTYDGNPARQDVEEIGAAIGIHLALNAILDEDRRIAEVLAGEPVPVMLAGIGRVRERCAVPVSQDYAVVVSSAGGHPKDLNVYQAQKAVQSAALIVRPGGTIVLVAACPEGSGSEGYERWVAERRTHRQVLDDFAAEGFRIGPHKAFQLARDAQLARIVAVSELPAELADRLLLETAPSVQAAIDDALGSLPAGERIAVLPHAPRIIPEVA